MIHFQNPKALLLLLALLPLAGLFLLSLVKRKNILSYFRTKDLPFKEAALYAALGFILIVLALAEPNEKQEEVKLSQAEVYFLLDTSGSMNVADTPSGLSRFEEGVSFINQSLQNKNLKGLVVFNETAEMTVPLTFDKVFFQLQLETLKPETGRSTDIAAPLAMLLKLPPSENPRSAILVSDGENQSGEALKPLISELRNKGFDVSAKIVGSTRGGLVPKTTFEGGRAYSRAHPDVLND